MNNNNQNTFIIIFSLLVLAGILIAPTPEGLSIEGKNAIGIFVMAIILWVSGALSVTGLFVIALLPLLDVMKVDEIKRKSPCDITIVK